MRPFTYLLAAIGLVPLFHSVWGQPINQILDSLALEPYTVSFHPAGFVLIAEYSRDTDEQVLILVDQNSSQTSIDTLQISGVNQAIFSKDGDYVLYNAVDPLSNEIYTIKRRFSPTGQFGFPTYVSQQLLLDNMGYYSMDGDETLYFYTHREGDPSRSGLFLSQFENGYYRSPELILANRENAVAYSPQILRKDTLIFTQHGIVDQTPNGIYYAFKHGDIWSAPIRLADLPFSHAITYYDEETLAFLLDKNSRIALFTKGEILQMINQ
ncbi:MAG: hypothetical protein AAFY91_06505 [Bacteroidota bacterium]